MGNFHRLAEIVGSMSAEAGAAPVKPLARGEFAGAAIVRLGGAEGGLHRQPNHEELLIVIEGEGEIRVGDEVRSVRPGDFVFVPRNAVHGTVSTREGPIAFLAILTPQFDLTKDVVWEKSGAAPRFEMV
ncbi:cupin domain-containing protein [Enhydrobacter sp.]|uniref:cupin domain-containing protein n=1 Tax=Enhydrobacter sp. TaxID=1894999 RepID=UPI00261FD942|nr:cupin domain-containing protein [Enhydrobacter sp.]WIM11626.1 MAG: cupin domain-containing protein [Enhydrobacter sp.]